MKRVSLFFALAVCCIAGCSEVEGIDPNQPTPEPEKIPIRLKSDISLKATDTSYEVGDQIGVYVVNYVNGKSGALANAGNHIDNTKFTYDGTMWNSEKEVYWKDQTTPADFYCYYPYVNVVGDVTAIQFSTQENQSELSGYKNSDVLYGKTMGAKPSVDPVTIVTNHAMSNVIIYVVPGKGYTEETLAAEDIKVYITGVKTKASLNLVTGKVTSSGEPKNIIPLRENGYWRALVVPQDITGTKIIEVKVGSNVYSLNQTITFASNKQHKCTLKVNKIGEGVNITIGGWETDDNDFGGTLE